MSVFNQLLDGLRIELPGALDGTIRLQIFNTLDELCRTADAWRSTGELTLVAGQQQYALTLPTGSKLVRVMAISHKSLMYHGAAVDETTVIFHTVPTADDAQTPAYVDVSLALAGVNGLDDTPSEIFEVYYLTCLHGTLARMMAQPAKPYSNTRLAEYHGRKFRNLMALARPFAKTNGYAAQSWRFPKFGA